MSVEEQWRAIPGWEGFYEVSDLGQVRSLERRVPWRGGTRIQRARMLTPYVGFHGRRQVTLSRLGHDRRYLVYRLVMLAFTGPCPPGMEVCHYDGDRTNDAWSNLRYDTRGNNHRDKVRHGTHNEAKKTCCPRGHRLIEPNLMASAIRCGHRNCLACDRARANVQYARRTGREYDFVAWANDHYARIMAEAS